MATAEEAEIERLQAQLREAFMAGFWAWAGPANEVELSAWTRDEEESWTKWWNEHNKKPAPAGDRSGRG